MTDSNHCEKRERRVCAACGGSGQLSFFRGVSRFVMDWEDCPECHATGLVETEPPPAAPGGQQNSAAAAPENLTKTNSDDHD